MLTKRKMTWKNIHTHKYVIYIYMYIIYIYDIYMYIIYIYISVYIYT